VQPNFQTFIIKTPELFESLQNYANAVNSEYLAYDVETNSKIEKKADIFGVGIAFNVNKAFYIPIRRKDGTKFWDKDTEATIVSWLKSMIFKHKVIGHNIIYDALVTENNFNFTIDEQIYADTILMRHSLVEDGDFALKEIAVQELGPWADKAQDTLMNEVLAAGGSWTRDQKDMWMAETDTLGEYCCWDVILTMMLFELMDPKIASEGLYDLFYKEEVMPLYKEVTINMKRRGFPIDEQYYQNLKQDITSEIDKIEDDIMHLIKKDIATFEKALLEKECPVKATGNFPKYYAEAANIPLPVNAKTGAITLSRKAIEQQKATTPQFADLYNHILGTGTAVLDPIFIEKAQRLCFFERNPDRKYIFNLSSNDHLIELVFNRWGLQSLEKTEKGKPKIDDDYLETQKGNPVIDKLLDYKKLNKLLSTYVDGILDRQLRGVIYTSMLQFGTTSGRYSSRDPNLQNQPRVKDEESGLSALVLKYVNAIRKGFVAGKGYKVVNADYASLEPVCFAHVSGDEKLRDVFRNGEDLYSRVGIETFQVKGASALKKAPNYLKNLHPEIRQTAKTIALAIPYGAEASRISDILNVSYKEAQDIITKYLSGFPNLSKYMFRQNYHAKRDGMVKTEFGRIRHLREAKAMYALYGDELLDYKWANRNNKTDLRRKFKNSLNNAKNFPIQGLAAHIVNRAMIAITRQLKAEGLDAYIALQVHDEITCIAREDHADRVASIVKDCMENTTKISVPLVAEPLIADNWGEAK
jgi:DNA polymerase I-like protein with 3'-5' exonuclease and polymerase domains